MKEGRSTPFIGLPSKHKSDLLQAKELLTQLGIRGHIHLHKPTGRIPHKNAVLKKDAREWKLKVL